MGCDIHAYVEYKSASGWTGFGGKINPGRHYGIFSGLCGVRNNGIVPLSEPRGLPEDIGWQADSDNKLFITDDRDGESGCCTPEAARLWIERGASVKVGDNYVTHPDWHSHSWVSSKELEQVLSSHGIEFDSYIEPGWIALMDLLKSFVRQGYESRIVFWFDN